MSAKYDTTQQQNAEELDMMKEQVRYKQELIEQFESNITGLADQQRTQVTEMQAVND